MNKRRDYRAARLTFYSEDGSAETDTFDLFATIHPSGFASVDIDRLGCTIGTADSYYSLLEAVQTAVSLISPGNLSQPEEVDIADYYPALAQ